MVSVAAHSESSRLAMPTWRACCTQGPAPGIDCADTIGSVQHAMAQSIRSAQDIKLRRCHGLFSGYSAKNGSAMEIWVEIARTPPDGLLAAVQEVRKGHLQAVRDVEGVRR